MRKFVSSLVTALFILTGVYTVQATDQSVFDFTLPGLDGKPLPLEQFRGRAVLLVNTASECGYTPQYDGLEKLWEQYKARGLVVIGVPSNDFGGQEPGKSEEIAQFCRKNFGVTFPLADKSVVSGAEAIPVYKWAANHAGFMGKPRWNFHKYLFDKQGKFVEWFASTTEPDSTKITNAVATVLGE
ncbi:glutathione peroxidase [Aestuariivirga litoralis]|uniref:glutathione peroxidase n=1 Tax=Aestuariivirga litoralis TaxID=2650924 RepID=UPI0018C512A6|nr:glutathione peroxidase [Aestuariivirga litoralis]MBG1232446.1 glutathione peroxidase [Aestuariivirga litoralis]